MAYTRHAKGSRVYSYPVELVWRSIAGGARTVQPIDEAKYENTTPRSGEVYTRSLEYKLNEAFAFEMKAARYTTRWRVTLDELGSCRTRVSVQADSEYPDLSSFLLCRMGSTMPREIHYFLKNIDDKLEAGMKGR